MLKQMDACNACSSGALNRCIRNLTRVAPAGQLVQVLDTSLCKQPPALSQHCAHAADMQRLHLRDSVLA